MFNIVLVEPEIPANTGNIGRTCVVSGTHLHLVGPLGFSLDSKQLKRAGMAYWESLQVSVYNSWDEFVEKNKPFADPTATDATATDARGWHGGHTDLDRCDPLAAHSLRNQATSPLPQLHFLTKKATKTYTEANYKDGDFIIFGKESSGLDEQLLAQHPFECERIPMLTDEKALVNATDWSDHIAQLRTDEAHANTRTHEALLQQDICGNFIDPEDYHVSALNLSNAAAIVLYEALRQTGFVGM